ncbi:MAG: radical SAM protein, partial [Planctomycetes bacterium]|nr:radical SAM protein [Planctomycetota bacterium]
MSASAKPFEDHRREYADMKYVYPVVSRRSRGLSIGVNLNPDKVCNWDCPYCQVDRKTPATTTNVDESVLIDEMRRIMVDVNSGEIWNLPRFAATPESFRR